MNKDKQGLKDFRKIIKEIKKTFTDLDKEDIESLNRLDKQLKLEIRKA